MAVLISGIGRSGTTTLYQILGKAMLAKFPDARCVYEPYLWNIPDVERTANVKGQPFGAGQVGIFNVAVHCSTPLFLSGRNMLHDAWLRKVFAPGRPSAKKTDPGVLAKVIRGSGRLEAALTRFENLKIVIVTRNVVDTVNSGLGLFSFFGDEFHLSDKKRFLNEVNRNFGVKFDISCIKDELHWSVLWWHYFTLSSFATFRKFHDRVLLVPYEKYNANKIQVMGDIFDFLGIEKSCMDLSSFEENAGPRTSVSYLSVRDIDQMADEIVWYCKQLKDTALLDINPHEFRRELINKYSRRKLVASMLRTERTDLTAVQWRIKMKEQISISERSLSARVEDVEYQTPVTLSQAISMFGSNAATVSFPVPVLQRAQPVKTVRGKSLGVVITCFNNEKTIAEAIYSVLAQSLKPDVILVADDCSMDKSASIVRDIASQHNEVRLVERKENVGVSANRDLAIRALDTDYVTTLDGDDLYLPRKLELEYAALSGRDDMVSFSDIAVLSKRGQELQKCLPYSRKNCRDAIEFLLTRSTPVPRDLMFHKKLFKEAGGFDVGLRIYEDWAFKMRLMIIAGDRAWVHSGGVGTLYDRRVPGLSGWPLGAHAWGQLVAIARNAELLRPYPSAIAGGIRIICRNLEGNECETVQEFADLVAGGDVKIYDTVINALGAVWRVSKFGQQPELALSVIRNAVHSSSNNIKTA